MYLVYHRILDPKGVKWYRYEGVGLDLLASWCIQVSGKTTEHAGNRPAAEVQWGSAWGNKKKDEDQGQETKVDVGVPGRSGFPANVFRVGTPGSFCAGCRGICGHRICGWKCVHAAPWLGIGRGPGC